MRIYILFVLLTIAITVSSQVIQVRDAITLQPVEFVTVVDLATQQALTAGQKGEVDISAFRDMDSLAFSHIGYELTILSYDQTLSGVLLMPKSFSLDDVVISANRWEQDLREVPNRIVAINKEAIAFYNPQTSADLLAQSGSVYIQKSQFGGGSPMIRGFATNRLLMVIDGVRMNSAIFRSGNIQNVLSIDPNALEGVEVIYGPGSIMYGSDALGGVMDFHTITPEFSTSEDLLVEGDAFSRFSSANQEITGHLNLKLGKEKWASITSLGYTRVDDLRMGSFGPDEYLRPEYVAIIDGVDSILVNDDPELQVPSDMMLGNIMQKIRFSPSENWDFQYGFYWSQTSDHDRYDRLIEYRDGLPRSAEWYYGPMLWNMHQVKLEYNRSNRFYDGWRLIAAYQLFEESRIDRSFNGSTQRSRFEEVDAWSVNADFHKTTGQLSWFYGTEFVTNLVGSSGTDKDIISGIAEVGPSRYPDGATWTSLAAYVSNKWKLTESFTVQTGARYNHIMLNAQIDDTFYPFPFSAIQLNRGAVTGSAGLAWLMKNWWQWNLNLSTGFRSPNVDDIGKVFDSEPGNVTVPNPDLLPEYAYNVDLGWVFRSNTTGYLGATGFYTLLDNAIVRRLFSLDGADSILYDGELSQVLALQNIDRAYVYGLEVNGRWQATRFLAITGSLTLTEGYEQAEETGADFVPLRHAPPLFGSVHAMVNWKAFRADMYVDYNAEIPFDELAPSEVDKPHLYAVDENGNPYCPAWTTLNLKMSYQLGRAWQVHAGVENILDIRYRPYSSGIVAPGRNFLLSARFLF